ncbi:MAG: hypothetical protein R3E68_15845 [Burkholderiaceae bacterium]
MSDDLPRPAAPSTLPPLSRKSARVQAARERADRLGTIGALIWANHRVEGPARQFLLGVAEQIPPRLVQDEAIAREVLFFLFTVYKRSLPTVYPGIERLEDLIGHWPRFSSADRQWMPVVRQAFNDWAAQADWRDDADAQSMRNAFNAVADCLRSRKGPQ